jgi:acetyl-CoA carboxylase carboxyl transferase subunit alpha
VPLISVIIGEGGSGGAIAIATANAVLMLEHAIYSVISPEGAATILWRDSTRAKDAASSMRITAQDLRKLGIIDDIIGEPLGAAHRGPEQVLAATDEAISRSLRAFSAMPPDALKQQRRDKFLAIGRDL